MPQKKILFISGSLGLGHIARDLAIARELRNLNSKAEIFWLTANPQSKFLEEEGEKLLPESDQYVNESFLAEKSADGFRLSLIQYAFKARKEWNRNVEIFLDLMSREQFDMVIGDETYEINIAFKENPELKKLPYTIIYDFLGFDSMTKNPLEKMGVWIWNRVWAKGYKKGRPFFDLGLFVGEEGDIPDKKFGLGLPNRRDLAKARYKFIGYILPFDPKDHADKKRIRTKLGYGDEMVVICSIGGTNIGKGLLELCGEAYPIVKARFPNLRFILNCGPRLETSSLKVPQGVEVRGYMPRLYEHFAAADLAIVQGGGTSTLELTALRRPFIYFPLEGHCEQEIYIALRLARHQAGIKMIYSQTSPESLAERVIANIGKEVTWPPIAVDGAKKAALLINQLLGT